MLCTLRAADVQVVTEVAKGSRGVVGCTPILKPGECFEYYRCCRWGEAAGAVQGLLFTHAAHEASHKQRSCSGGWLRGIP